MSRKLKILAILNVVGWLVAVPLLLSALVGPIVGFSDWPGAPGSGAGPVPEVQLGGRDAGDENDVRAERDSGSSSSESSSASSRAALDRALLRQTLDSLPGGPATRPEIERALPLSEDGPSRPVSVRGRPGGVRDLGTAPPLVPDPPRGSGPPAPAAGPNGEPAPAPTPAPPSGPDVPAPAAGGDRARGDVRPGGGRFSEAQVPANPDAAPTAAGQTAVAVAVAEPPAPAVEAAGAVPAAPAVPAPPVPVPAPAPPAEAPAPPGDDDEDHPAELPEPPAATRPQDDLPAAPAVEDCPPPGDA